MGNFCQKIVFLCQFNAFLNIKLQKNGQFLSKIVILCQNVVIFCQNFKTSIGSPNLVYKLYLAQLDEI